MQRTADQNKEIWKLVGRLAIAAGQTREWAMDIMHDICEEFSGQRHSHLLTTIQANQLIERLQDACQKEHTPPLPPPFYQGGSGRCKRGRGCVEKGRARRSRAPTKEAQGVGQGHALTKKKPSKEAQRIKDPQALATTEMLDMMHQLFKDLGWVKDSQKLGFYKRVLGRDSIGPITRKDCLKVIEALKAILSRKIPTEKIRDMIKACAQIVGAGLKPALTSWEIDLLYDLQQKILKGKKPSPRAVMKLEEIYEKRVSS